MKFTATIKNLEIRGKEICTSKKDNSEYIVVRLEDINTGSALELVDKELSRADYYVRGEQPEEVVVTVDIGKFTTVRIVDLKLKAPKTAKK